jgi:hypothetical protein
LIEHEPFKRDSDRPSYNREPAPPSDLSALYFRFNFTEQAPEESPSFAEKSGEDVKPPKGPSITTTRHVLDVDGYQVTVVERTPDIVSNEPPLVYFPGYLEGLESNEAFLSEFSDRSVYAIEVTAGVDRFEAFRKVVEQIQVGGERPDVLTHSMGSFVIDHDFSTSPEDADLFGKVVMMTPPGFIENDSVVKLLGRYVSEVWQSTFSQNPDYRRNAKVTSLLEAFHYVRRGIIGTIKEAFRVPKTDLSYSISALRQQGKEVYAVLTTDDRLLPGDKTREGLLKGGLTDREIDTVEGTHIPHQLTPKEVAEVIKARLRS